MKRKRTQKTYTEQSLRGKVIYHQVVFFWIVSIIILFLVSTRCHCFRVTVIEGYDRYCCCYSEKVDNIFRPINSNIHNKLWPRVSNYRSCSWIPLIVHFHCCSFLNMYFQSFFISERLFVTLFSFATISLGASVLFERSFAQYMCTSFLKPLSGLTISFK